MNKKIWIIILIFIIALILIFLLLSQNKKTISPYTEFTDSIKLTIKDDKIIDETMTIVITNESEIQYEYGVGYDLEIKEGNSWYVVSPKYELDNILIAYTINPGETREININLASAHGKLSSGHYRLIKDFSYKTDNTNYKYLPATVEFDIK